MVPKGRQANEERSVLLFIFKRWALYKESWNDEYDELRIHSLEQLVNENLINCDMLLQDSLV